MTLREKQSLFVRLTAHLIQHATSLGYELTYGETYRTQEQAILNAKAGKGIKNSVHCDRLAVDFNLFKDGKYLPHSESHRQLGEYWKSLDSDCRWGGEFKDSRGNPKPDGNHYSLEHGGRK